MSTKLHCKTRTYSYTNSSYFTYTRRNMSSWYLLEMQSKYVVIKL